MHFTHSSKSKAPLGFSLVELLLVISIIAIISTFSVGAIKSFGSAYELDSSVQGVTGILNSARQMALSQNKYVQVRFYEQTNAADSRHNHYFAIGTYVSDSPYYTNAAGYQSLESKGFMKAAANPYVLPSSMGIVKSSSQSQLLDALSKDATIRRTNQDASGRMQGYPWTSFYFTPQGSIDVPHEGTGVNIAPLSPSKSYFSLCDTRRYTNNVLPANHAIILFDPANGRLQVTRP